VDGGCEFVYSNHWPDFSTPLRFARNDNEMDPGAPGDCFMQNKANRRPLAGNPKLEILNSKQDEWMQMTEHDFAKQSQFLKKSNLCKIKYNKEL